MTIATVAAVLVFGVALGALFACLAMRPRVARTEERLLAATTRTDALNHQLDDLTHARAEAERAAHQAQREVAVLQATLAQTSESQEKVIDALLERAKNELRETTAKRASERVGELLGPISEKLGAFGQVVREIEGKRNEDVGNLKEQIASLLSRAEKLELATSQLSTHTSTLVSALRDPKTSGILCDLDHRWP